MSEEVRTAFVWDTRGVEAGAQKIEKAFDRVGAAEKESLRGSGNGGGVTEAAMTKGLVRAEQSLKRHHAEMEREQAAHNRRLYQEADKSAQYRHQALLRSLQRENTAMRSGGHGGGSGGSARGLGDTLNILTGGSGNVMRLNALTHAGLPIAGAAAGLVAAGGFAYLGNRFGNQYNAAGAANAGAREGFGGVSRASMFSGAGQGEESLSEQIAAHREQLEKESAAQRATYQTIEERDRNPMTRGYYGAIQRWKTSNYFQGEDVKQTPEEMAREQKSRIGITASQMQGLIQARAEAGGHAADTARERMSGSGFKAQKMEIDMAEKAAEIAAEKAQLTGEEWKKKTDIFELQRKGIDLDERAAKANSEAAKEIADDRSNAEGKARQTADTELVRAHEVLRIEKERGSVESIRQAQVAVAQASERRFYMEREQAIARAGREASLLSGGYGVTGAASRASLAYYGANQQAQFQSGQLQQGAAAAQGVGSAQMALDAAREKARLDGDSEDSLAAIAAAEQGVTKAKIEQLDVMHRLAAEQAMRSRAVLAERVSAENQTRAMRFANSGRADLAAIHGSRSAANAQALELERAGRPDLANEIMEQQRLREVGQFDDKFLNPNGTRRSRARVNADDRRLRLTSQRRDRANSRLEKDLGLVDVRRDISGNVTGGMDPLTREKLSAEDVYARRTQNSKQARAEAAEESSPKITNLRLGTIVELLQTRLPAK